MPVHGDAGYFVAPKCSEKRRLSLTGGWYSGYGAASKLLPSLFYQICYIISPLRYKYVSRIAYSILCAVPAYFTGFTAQLLFGTDPLMGMIVTSLILALVQWGGYVESGEQFNVVFISAVVYYFSVAVVEVRGEILPYIAFIMALDIWFCKQSVAFVYLPLSLFGVLVFPDVWRLVSVAHLVGFGLWTFWTACCGFQSPIDALNNLRKQQLAHKGSMSWMSQYRLKIIRLSKQLMFTLPIVVASLYGILSPIVTHSWKPGFDISLLLLIGMCLSYFLQTNICWYFGLPILLPLSLLTLSINEPIVLGIVVLTYLVGILIGYQKLWEGMSVYLHMNRAKMMEKLFEYLPVPEGKTLSVVGNDTQAYLLNPGAVCPNPRWIANSFLQGAIEGDITDKEKYDYFYYGVPNPPRPSADYKVLAQGGSKTGHGNPCVLMATGPSLESVPDAFLRKYKVMGVNNCFLRRGIYPDFYVRTGKNHLDTPEKRKAIFPVVEHSKAAFLGRRFAHHFPFHNVYPLYSDYDERVFQFKDYQPRDLKFSLSPLEWVATYATVTYIALQLLYYMGADPALVVGLDHTYSGANRHFYKDQEAPQFPIEARDTDPKEVEHARYLSEQADRCYRKASSIFQSDGRRILNLTSTSLATEIEFDSILNW
jgi:hypothetical protein